MFARLAFAAIVLLAPGAAAPAARTGASGDIAAACGTREGWADPAPPAHVHGRTWYVGTCGISVILVETRGGLVLIDSGPAEAAQGVLANIRALGLDPRRIRWILSTHEHFDHAGGFAEIERQTGARLAVGPFAAAALRSGKPLADDPQAEVLESHPMAPARVDRVLRDGESLVVGETRFTAHATPTHSPGSTSWTWRSCEQGKCLTIAYADSITTISSDDYRFTDHPDRIEAARAGLRAIEALPCDLMLTPHPGGSNLLARLSGKAPLVDPHACVAYAAAGSQGLARRLAREQGNR